MWTLQGKVYKYVKVSLLFIASLNVSNNSLPVQFTSFATGQLFSCQLHHMISGALQIVQVGVPTNDVTKSSLRHRNSGRGSPQAAEFVGSSMVVCEEIPKCFHGDCEPKDDSPVSIHQNLELFANKAGKGRSHPTTSHCLLSEATSVTVNIANLRVLLRDNRKSLYDPYIQRHLLLLYSLFVFIINYFDYHAIPEGRLSSGSASLPSLSLRVCCASL